MTFNPQETYKKSGLTVRIRNKEKEILQSVRYENKNQFPSQRQSEKTRKLEGNRRYSADCYNE